MNAHEIAAKYGHQVEQRDASSIASLEELYSKAKAKYDAAKKNGIGVETAKGKAELNSLNKYANDLMKGWRDAKELADNVHNLYFSIFSLVEGYRRRMESK